MDYMSQIDYYFQLEINTIQKLDRQSLNMAINELEEARLRYANIYICGNGGSSATASHFVCDFNKGISYDQDIKYNFICLNDNIPFMTATANDLGYEYIFEVPLRGRITEDDVLIAISGSGNSPDVLRAAEYARSAGAKVIALTGYDGGKLFRIANINLHVPVNNMQIAEDIHMIFDHVMMWILAYGVNQNKNEQGADE